MFRGVLPPLVAAAALVFAAGCGSDEDSGTASTADSTTSTEQSSTTTTPSAETLDPPAKLPDGWRTLINKDAGFSVGVPPEWTDEPIGGAQGSVLSSPDGLIVITITADRSRGALELPLEEFAQRTAEALGSEIVGSEKFEDLEVYGTAPFEHTYDAAAARAQGTAQGNDFRERVLAVAIRRPDQATYVVLVRENDEEESQFADRDTIKEVVRSLRGRPPS